jgi:methionyl-tRNA synthetase
MFPSTLLGTGEKWTMMKTISVTEYLNYEAGIAATVFFNQNA